MAGPLLLPGETPVPDKLTVCGDPVPLSVTVIVADSLAVEEGVNAIAIVQLEPIGTAEAQLLLCVKSAAFVPLSVTPETVRGAVPVLEMRIGCAGLVTA